MCPNPESFLEHLKSEGYHPRSDKHSNTLAHQLALDLVRHAPRMGELASSGRLVYDLNFTLVAGRADWNVDLVLGSPPLDSSLRPEGISILRMTPSVVQVAIEIKSVMTEHKKAVKNRKRDLEAHHEHVHNYNASAIAGGVLVINASSTFKSPLRAETTTHRNPIALVEHCISELRNVATRGGMTGYGLEAKCGIVVDVNNLNPESYRYLTRPPAPAVGDPLHYDAFIRTVGSLFTARY